MKGVVEEAQSGVSHLRRQEAPPAGPENLARLESNLWRNRAATQYLIEQGLQPETIRKFHLGIKEPYRRKSDGKTVSGLLCYPLISRSGEPLGRYSYYAIPGVTENPPEDGGWGPGKYLTYYSGDITGKIILLVIETCRELWVLDQHLRGIELDGPAVIISPSHGSGVPQEWKSREFWAGWHSIYYLHSGPGRCEQMAQALIRHCGREVYSVVAPEEMGHSWPGFLLSGGTSERFTDLLKGAPVLSHAAPAGSDGPQPEGEFAVNPVNINGAFVNGHLYYPFTVERRALEKSKGGPKGSAGRMVASYVTKVVRSDGAVLDIVRLDAPRGTPIERQVLALTDGTRIEKEPHFSHHATWQLESIQLFIRAAQGGMPAPHRPLKEILADVDAHLRRSVWLPYEDDYTVIALYVVLSYVYQVFEAIPLLMVRGEKGTGKSELGDAISRVSCNATVIGQGSTAGVVRLLNETRGLVVLDDLESVGRLLEKAAFGDINQMLKLSYKRRTGRKAITDKNGKTTVFDFYGPKVINNTRGVDPILGSRMLHIQTRGIPEAIRREVVLTGSEPDDLMRLRDELHIWGMTNASRVNVCYRSLADPRGERKGEISAPLRAIARFSGDAQTTSSLESALARQFERRRNIENPVELLKEAINNCIRRGVTERIAGTQIALEVRLLAEDSLTALTTEQNPSWQRPEWIGHQLLKLQIRNPRLKVKRARLYGLVTRIYDLHPEYVRAVMDEAGPGGTVTPPANEPFDFCERTVCTECAYEKVCRITIHGLKTNKSLNKGKSGLKAKCESG